MLPSLLVQKAPRRWMTSKLLVLTTAVIDVEDMWRRCELPAKFQHGGVRSPDVKDCAIVFSSVGLAWKQYLAKGLDFADGYSMVLLDEAGDLDHDPLYAYLLEVFLRISKGRALGIVLSSATLPPRVSQVFPAAPRVVCVERQHSLQLYRWQAEPGQDLYLQAAALAERHLAEGRTVMVFVPGKAEIEAMAETLPRARMLHGEMAASEIQAVVRGSTEARVILSTSVGEKGVTIPGVDVVIDVGFVRFSRDAVPGLRELSDARASMATTLQRAGRCGRTKPGVAYRLTYPGEELGAKDRTPDLDSLMSVLALQQTQPTAIRIDECRLLQPLPEGRVEELAERLEELFPRGGALALLSKLPLSVSELALLKEAKKNRVSQEVAGLLSLVSCRRVLSNKRTTTVLEALQLLRGEVATPEGTCSKGLDFARQRWRDLQGRCKMASSPYYDDYLQQAVAATYLQVYPERLLWKKDGSASLMGEAVEVAGDDGFYVMIDAYRRRGRAAMCTLTVPASDWALKASGVAPLTRTSSCVGDSTLWPFREAVNRALRAKGVDLRAWKSLPGASEQEVAEALQEQPACDLAIVVPNGNRLAKQEETREPHWLRRCCDELAGAIKGRAKEAVVFVGDAVHSPGVKDSASYQVMISMYQEALRERGLSVLGDLPQGIEISSDGIHWTPSSAAGVEKLVADLVAQCRSTTAVRGEARKAAAWHWGYSETDARHYPVCACCNKRLSQDHLDSRTHREAFKGDADAFADIRQLEEYSWRGRQFARSDGSLRSDAKISSREAPLTARASAEALPPGWSEHVDPDTGNVFYHDVSSRESQWTKPRVEPYDAYELPSGWVMYLD